MFGYGYSIWMCALRNWLLHSTGGDEAGDNVLQLHALNLQLGGQNLTLGS